MSFRAMNEVSCQSRLYMDVVGSLVGTAGPVDTCKRLQVSVYMLQRSKPSARNIPIKLDRLPRPKHDKYALTSRRQSLLGVVEATCLQPQIERLNLHVRDEDFVKGCWPRSPPLKTELRR